MSRSDDRKPTETEVKIGNSCTKAMFDVCERLAPVMYSCCSHYTRIDFRVGAKRDPVASIQYRRIHSDVIVYIFAH